MTLFCQIIQNLGVYDFSISFLCNGTLSEVEEFEDEIESHFKHLLTQDENGDYFDKWDPRDHSISTIVISSDDIETLEYFRV